MSDTGKIIALARTIGKVNVADTTKAVDDWLEENITNPDSPPLDRTLSSSSSAAPADMVGDLKSAISNTNKYIARRYYAERGQVNTSNQESVNNAKCRTEVIDLTKVKKIITNIPSTLSLSAATVKVNGSWVASSGYIHVNNGYIWFEDAAEAVRLCYTHKNGDGQALTDAEIDALYMYQYIDLYENYDTLSASVAAQFSELNAEVDTKADKLIDEDFNHEIEILVNNEDSTVASNASVNSSGASAGASIAYSNSKIVISSAPSQGWASAVFTLFSWTATSKLPDYLMNPNVSAKLNIEFDYETTMEQAKVTLTDKSNNAQSVTIPASNNGHLKCTQNATDNKYITIISDKAADAGKTLKIWNVKVYYGNQWNVEIEDYLAYLNGKVIPLLYDPQVQVIDSGNDYNVYDAAVVNTNGGTKAFENNYLKWVTPSADAGNSFNITLYGTTATMVSDKYNNPYVASVLTFEFDYDSDATTAVVYCKSNANVVKSATMPTGTGHAKLTFDLASVNNLNITCTDKTVDLSKTIKIKNLILYYGMQGSTPIIGVQDIPQYSKFLAIGDSLTNGCLWQPFAARMLNVPIYTRSGGSGGTIAVSDHAPIYTAIQSLTAELAYDLITLWGGTNDWTHSIPMGDFDESLDPETRDVETFYGALVGCVETLSTLYPTARIILVGTTPRASRNGLDTYHNTPNSLGLYLEDYVNAVENVAKYYGCPFLDLLRTSGINEINLPDWMVHQDNGQGQTYYLHFNQWATEKIGRRIGSFIKGLGY